MASSQFKVTDGLYANGTATFKSIATGDLATNDKILVVNTNGDLQYVQAANVVSQGGGGGDESFINAIIFG